MFKFIHAADIHLDSKLKGLERYEGAPVQEIREAARHALSKLVDLAIKEDVALVLIAGDLYDGDWQDMHTGFFFISQASRLREANIPLFLIAGNHDAENRITRSLRLPTNVTFFAADAPESKVLEELGVAIHGQSFSTAAVLDDLSHGYPAAKPGCFNIGLLHTCASGREGHDRYAPCTIEGLKSKGYDYWALGHIHTRETLCQTPYIAFPGNIQGRHVRETGPKGCLLVTVEDDRSLEVEFKELDVLRWESPEIDVSQAESLDDVLDLVRAEIGALRRRAAGLSLAMRVNLVGECVIHHELLAERAQLVNEIRSAAIDLGQSDIWIEKLKLGTTAPNRKMAADDIPDDAMAELLDIFKLLKGEPDKITETEFEFADVLKKLPAELSHLAPSVDATWVESVVSEAESRLVSRLTRSEKTK